MKKRALLLSTFAISLLAVTSLSMTASAETTVEKEATASFKLVAPTTGTLKIEDASNLTFKDATISADDVITTSSEDTFVKIQELSGEAPGWQLSAKLDDFVGSTTKNTLTGAAIFYPKATITTTDASNVSEITPVSEITADDFSKTSKGAIVTAGGDAANIVTAEKGKGYGTWTMTYPAGSVQLKVPAGNLKDSYTAKLTYTLVDSPK